MISCISFKNFESYMLFIGEKNLPAREASEADALNHICRKVRPIQLSEVQYL